MSMISFNDYKTSLELLHTLPTDSWVDFEEKEISNALRPCKVVVPRLYSKPSKFIRILYWLWSYFTGISQSEHTAKKLLSCLKISMCAIRDANVDLKLQALEISEVLLKKLTRDPTKRASQERAIEELRAELISEQQLASTLQACKLGQRNQELALAMDWSKDEPTLFHQVYVNDLLSQKQDHPDMMNPFINNVTKDQFLTSLSTLMHNEQVQDKYRTLLSKENTSQLRLMMLAIMNQVNGMRREPNFPEFHATVISCLCLAIDNCSNRFNTEIEAVYTGLNYPKEGNLGFRIYLALQEMRRQIFHKAIHLCIAKNSYYLSHEAASLNYYNREMAEKFGLPPSISNHDSNFANCVMKDQEESITQFFTAEYTPFAIFKKISEIIQDPNDSSIPCKLFTDWVQTRYREDVLSQVLDHTGRYQPECFIRLFEELQVFS